MEPVLLTQKECVIRQALIDSDGGATIQQFFLSGPGDSIKLSKEEMQALFDAWVLATWREEDAVDDCLTFRVRRHLSVIPGSNGHAGL